MLRQIIITLLVCFGIQLGFSQEKKELELKFKDSIKNDDINPLAPAKAGFYSAILPGLGQAYNKKYWKIPLVYGAMGASFYFYSTNNTLYKDFREAYKRRLLGFNDDKYQYLDNARLITGQRFYQRNRDLSLLITVAFYVLNIVDANVDAHLGQFNVNDNLSFQPNLIRNDIQNPTTIALSFNYKF